MSALWIQCPTVAVGLWYEQGTQVSFIDGMLNAERQRGGSLRPLAGTFIHEHHLTIRKLETSQFLHDQQIRQTRPPLSMFGGLPIAMDEHIPFPAITQLLCRAIEEEWRKIPRFQHSLATLLGTCSISTNV